MKKNMTSCKAACLLTMAAVLLTMTSLTSCREDELHSQEPTYDKMFFCTDSIDFQGEIKPVYSFRPGQTVYVGILIADDGAYITRADQTWTLRGHGIDDVTSLKSVVAPCGKEPTWAFQAPDLEGEDTVSFKEKYNFSASKLDGTIFGQSGTISAKFRVR